MNNKQKMHHSLIDQMVREYQLRSPEVVKAMHEVPRYKFVPEELQHRAFEATAFPIGADYTISHPGLVGYMIEALELNKNDKVLDVGSGTGYHAAVIAGCVKHVWGIECLKHAADDSKNHLADAGISNVTIIHGDGYEGHPTEAPFDAINVACAAKKIPEKLLEQLAPGGRMILPVEAGKECHGERDEELQIVRKDASGNIEIEQLLKVRFVPMVHMSDTD